MKKLICLVLAVMLALSAVSAFAAEYTDKETVKKVQQALNDAGFNCGTPDGAAGKKTKAAITDYQNANGLTATGVIDDELLVSLGLAEAEAAVPAEETPVEAETDGGYTFQGIPWGSSPEEVEAILVEKGLIEAGMLSPYTGDSCVYPAGDSGDDFFYTFIVPISIENVGGYESIRNPLKAIGGYEETPVVLYYLYGIENNAVEDDLHLSMVKIQIDTNGAFDDLTGKLSDTYGNYKEASYPANFSLKVRTWVGADHTIIGLAHADGTEAALIYAKTDDYLKAAQIQEINEASKAPLEDAGL